MEEKFYRISDVEKMLSVSKSTLKRWIKSGKIKAVRFGNPWKISESALEEFKKKNIRHNTRLES